MKDAELAGGYIITVKMIQRLNLSAGVLDHVPLMHMMTLWWNNDDVNIHL